MKITRQQLKLLHVARKDRQMTDAHWREALMRIAGVTSVTELDQEGFDAIMAYLVYLGFKPWEAPDYGEREGMATAKQLALIRQFWREVTHNAYDGEDELNKWLLRSWKVSSLRFLTKVAAQGAITALLAMKKRAA